MRQLLHLKEVVKLKNGLKFSLKVLFETFLIGILFSVLSELVFLAFAKFLNIDIYLNTEVIMSILTASFLTFIFSRKNIFNQLFISGFSRKKIARIKTFSCIIYGLVYFLLYIIYEIFYSELISNIMELNTILSLIVIYFAIMLVSEFATFLALLYKNISVKKGKGINKTFYRYIYSFAIILLTYVYRLIYPDIYEYYTDIILIFIVLLLCSLQFLFAHINKKWILNIDIRA